jgi:glucosamine-6-phosphate deaminase
MPWELPAHLSITAEELGRGSCVRVAVVPDAAALAETLARDIFAEIADAREAGRGAALILPVGPVDQYRLLADRINRARLSLRHALLINMDEYLTDDDEWIPADHPLSFRGFMDREFYSQLDPELAPPEQLRLFPHPRRPEEIGRRIAECGGVDACFGGIGINGHIAFNEPPEPGQTIDERAFAALPTRSLSLARETRTINANTVGGSLDVIPARCVTVGMREILGARRLRFYCNRPWQSAVIRRALHGAVGPECPASYLRTHADAAVTVTRQVADPPRIALR